MLIHLNYLDNLSILDITTNKFKNFLYIIGDIIGYSDLKSSSSALIVNNIRIKVYLRIKFLINKK